MKEDISANLYQKCAPQRELHSYHGKILCSSPISKTFLIIFGVLLMEPNMLARVHSFICILHILRIFQTWKYSEQMRVFASSVFALVPPTKIRLGDLRYNRPFFDILKFSLRVRPRGHIQKKWINIVIQFPCLYPLSLTAKLNFYCYRSIADAKIEMWIRIYVIEFQIKVVNFGFFVTVANIIIWNNCRCHGVLVKSWSRWMYTECRPRKLLLSANLGLPLRIW